MQKNQENETTSPTHLLVFSPLYPPHIGGLESHAQQWNEHLTTRGYKITVWTPHIIPTSPTQEQHNPHLKIIRFPAWEIIPNYPIPKIWHPLFWRQLQHLRQQPITIVVSRTRFFVTSLLAMLWVKISRTPWLHIEHGSDHVHLHNPIATRLAKIWDYTCGRLIFNTATHCVANSQASAAFIKMLTPHRDVTVIYRGIDFKTLKEIHPTNLTKDYQLPTTNHTLIYVGRLIDGKGVHDLLRALYQLPITNYKLLIVGDGPQRHNLEQLSKTLRIDQHVFFLGEKSWSETIALLKTSDVFINPSYTEGLPTSVIEAALCQCAIIATNVGGTREIIEHQESGLLITPQQPQALAAALQQLLQYPELRQQFIQTAYAVNQQRFSWSTAIEQYDRLLQILRATET